MADRQGFYILLRDVDNPEYCENNSWWGVLSSYVSYNSEDSPTQPESERELALKGEILQALDSDKQPADHNRIALHGVKQIFLLIECDLQDVKLISEADTQLLLAVPCYSERCRIFNEGDIESLGRDICEGAEVKVRVKEHHMDVAAVVRYIGPAPPYDGTMFGVEILDPRYRHVGTCDGMIQCKRYFRCPQGSGLFVSIDKLHITCNYSNLSDTSLVEESSAHKETTKGYKAAKEEKEIKNEDSKQDAEVFEEDNSCERKVAADLIEREDEGASKRDSIPNIADNCSTNNYNGTITDHLAVHDNKDKESAIQSSSVDDIKQELFEVKILLSEKEEELQQVAVIWEETLKKERYEKKRLEEEVVCLREAVGRETDFAKVLEGRLEEEQKSWKTQRKAFYREWEEFERRLVEERAERTRIEERLTQAQHEMDMEREAKRAVQGELETVQRTARERERELQRQNEFLEWRMRELESSPRVDHVKGSGQHAQSEPPDWIISREEIQVTEKRLGVGGWGQVLEGKFRACDVAVKRIHDLILSPHNRRLFEREMSIASRCRHPCLLQFIGATNDDGTPLFVTELLDTNLRAVLESRAMTEPEILMIALDVAKALNYLHLNKPLPIIHRDISSANVLLWRRDDRWRAKVSDYGAANFMRQCRTINPGAVIYSAPEAFSAQQTPKIDVYSFGLLLCEMYIRELPVPDHTQEQVAMVTNHGLRDLIMRCVQKEHGKRPDMDEIISELEKL